MLEQVKRTIEEFHMIQPGDKIITGVSGGADSMCLFHVLLTLSEELDIRLHVVHVNHLLRKEAGEEEEYVRTVCIQNGIPYTVFQRDIAAYAGELGCSLEEAGRVYRYECFEAVCRQEKGQRIAVAHHLNDRAETLLFHAVRGTGMRGLGSIPAVRGRIIRPLLSVSRQDIEAYLAEKQIRYYQDASNHSLDYTRNILRHQVLPVLEQVNEKALCHMGGLSDLAEEYWSYVEEQAERLEQNAVIRCGDGMELMQTAAEGQPKLLLRHLVYRMLVQTAGSARDLAQEHVEQVLSLMNKPVGKRVVLPYELCAIRTYQGIRIQRKTEDARIPERMSPVPVTIPGITKLEHIGEVECRLCSTVPKLEISKKLYTEMLDYGKINGTLCIRNPMPGDYFIVNGLGDRKKLSRFFIDNKIPREERASVLVLAGEKQVYWIIGMRISEDLKLTHETEQVLQIEFRYEGERNG